MHFKVDSFEKLFFCVSFWSFQAELIVFQLDGYTSSINHRREKKLTMQDTTNGIKTIGQKTSTVNPKLLTSMTIVLKIYSMWLLLLLNGFDPLLILCTNENFISWHSGSRIEKNQNIFIILWQSFSVFLCKN